MKRNKDIWVLAFLFVIVVVGGIMLAGPQSTPESDISTTYNPGKNGAKGFYTLLTRLGYTTDRLGVPYTEIPRKTRVLIVTQIYKGVEGVAGGTFQRITREERDALRKWVESGGVVMFFSDNLVGVPAAFGATGKLGKGAVYAYNSRRPITNQGMRDYTNAVRILDTIDRHATKRDLILFDEYHHGFASSDSSFASMSRQVKVALALLVIAGLILCHTRGRRFGAVRNSPVTETLRPGFEFVEAVGRLYQRAGAADTATDILGGSFKQNLCARLGLPGDAQRDEITRRMGSSGTNAEVVTKTDRLLRACEPQRAGQKRSEQELLHIAREIRDLEQELGLGSINA